MPSATLTILNHGDTSFAESATIADFIELMNDPYYEQGFLEQEINKVYDEYNGIAQVFQSFYAKDAEGIEERGINSYQLVFFNDRWWIVSLLWIGDSNGVMLPEKYAGK